MLYKTVAFIHVFYSYLYIKPLSNIPNDLPFTLGLYNHVKYWLVIEVQLSAAASVHLGSLTQESHLSWQDYTVLNFLAAHMNQ